MFGLDMNVLQKELKKIEKLAGDTNKLAAATEKLNTLMPELISEIKRLNANLEKK